MHRGDLADFSDLEVCCQDHDPERPPISFSLSLFIKKNY